MTLPAYFARLRALAEKAHVGSVPRPVVETVHADHQMMDMLEPGVVLALVAVAEAASRQSLAQIDYTPEHADLFDALAALRALTAVAAQQKGDAR